LKGKRGKAEMKYLIQVTIILVITFLGEVLYKLLPLPIPASIYGLLILLAGLMTGIIKLEQVKPSGNFLLDIMPVMFVPAGVGMMDIWGDVSSMLLPLVFISLFTTVLVMAATGKTSDYILMKGRGRSK